MGEQTSQGEQSEERYRGMLRAYYERLKEERGEPVSSVAIEEVKLRLFLSLIGYQGQSSRLNDSLSSGF